MAPRGCPGRATRGIGSSSEVGVRNVALIGVSSGRVLGCVCWKSDDMVMMI